MKEQLIRLARRLRRAAVECHYRGMRPASEWLDDFAIDVERILAEVRLREQVELVRRKRVRPRFTSTELQSAEYVQHLNGRCDLQTCLFHLAEAHTAGKCTAGCRWCAAQAQRPHTAAAKESAMTASQLVETILVAARGEDPVIRLAVEGPDGAVLVDDWAIARLTTGPSLRPQLQRRHERALPAAGSNHPPRQGPFLPGRLGANHAQPMSNMSRRVRLDRRRRDLP